MIATYMADFETTVFEGQTFTEVWAYGWCRLGSENVTIGNNIYDFFNDMISQAFDKNIIVFFHNLKFDGSFLLNFMLSQDNFKQATYQDRHGDWHFKKSDELKNGEFSYMISDMGAWYDIVLKWHGHLITFRDSLKLLPFSVAKIGKDFGTKHQKTAIEYTGERHAGGVITDEERQYIANDVLVMSDALQIFFNLAENKSTIGACCIHDFRKMTKKEDWEANFPNMYDEHIDATAFDAENADQYIRRSYKGGWVYVVEGKENKIFTEGVTADVNSLYPSMMSSQSGNFYPVGAPRFYKGDTIPKQYLDKTKYYYFVRIRTRFYLKHGKLPFIVINGSWRYPSRTPLKSSDVLDENGEYCEYIRTESGEIEDTSVILTLTCTDWELLQEHYNLIDLQILDYCVFKSAIGIFDPYIDKYSKIKKESKGAKRQVAKLFLNNLYGKMAQSTSSSFKIARLSDGVLKFTTQKANDRKPMYIPIGSAITSYSRAFTIRAAQKNFHGACEQGFIYADTDSIHCDLAPEDVQGIEIHPVNFCCWKMENYWDKAIFVRAKTYIEHTTHEDGEKVEPYYLIKCAGMSKGAKENFNNMLVSGEASLTDFKVGLEVDGKLLPKQIKGGTLLVETTFKIHPKK